MHLVIWSAGLLVGTATVLVLLRFAGPRGRRWAADLAALAYIAVIAAVAEVTGAGYVLFPELGALSHDVFGRPGGRWARSPVLLILTPALAAMLGTLITRHLAYGFPSILLSVGGALLMIRVLRSPVAPAISAGLLPLVLGVTSWWYPPAVAFGAMLLAALSVLRARLFALPGLPEHPALGARAGRPCLASDYLWVPWFALFLAVAYAGVVLTGWRFLLYPPLVVIGFEMLSRTDHCPWVHRPLLLPLVCFLTAACGMASFVLLGDNPLAALVSMGLGIAILKRADMHAPPALAVALLPLVIDKPTPWYPVAVGVGTAILIACFLLYQAMLRLVEDNVLPSAGQLRGWGD